MEYCVVDAEFIERLELFKICVAGKNQRSGHNVPFKFEGRDSKFVTVTLPTSPIFLPFGLAKYSEPQDCAGYGITYIQFPRREAVKRIMLEGNNDPFFRKHH